MRGEYYLGVTSGGGVLCLLGPLLGYGGLTQRLARVLPVSRGLLQYQPIRGQYSGHVTSFDKSEASGSEHCQS